MHELIENYEKNAFASKSKNTRKTYVKELELFNEWLDGAGTDLSNFSRVDVQHYINWLSAKHLSIATINKKFRAIIHYCRFTQQEDYTANINITKLQDPNSVAPKSLERNERNQMLREVSRSGNKRNYALIMLLLNTGIRVSECSNLQLVHLYDIGEKKGFIRIVGKGNKQRTVPINSDVRFALSEYLNERSINFYDLKSLSDQKLNEPLFLSNRNNALSVRQIQKLINEYGQTNPHALRHTFATILLREKNEDITKVAQLLGHSNLTTTERYTKATEEEMLAAVEKITIANLKE